MRLEEALHTIHPLISGSVLVLVARRRYVMHHGIGEHKAIFRVPHTLQITDELRPTGVLIAEVGEGLRHLIGGDRLLLLVVFVLLDQRVEAIHLCGRDRTSIVVPLGESAIQLGLDEHPSLSFGVVDIIALVEIRWQEGDVELGALDRVATVELVREYCRIALHTCECLMKLAPQLPVLCVLSLLGDESHPAAPRRHQVLVARKHPLMVPLARHVDGHLDLGATIHEPLSPLCERLLHKSEPGGSFRHWCRH